MVEPELGGLEWMEGTVPTPEGTIRLSCSAQNLKVLSDTGTGTLRFRSRSAPSAKDAILKSKGGDVYEIRMDKGREYAVDYVYVG